MYLSRVPAQLCLLTNDSADTLGAAIWRRGGLSASLSVSSSSLSLPWAHRHTPALTPQPLT